MEARTLVMWCAYLETAVPQNKPLCTGTCGPRHAHHGGQRVNTRVSVPRRWPPVQADPEDGQQGLIEALAHVTSCALLWPERGFQRHMFPELLRGRDQQVLLPVASPGLVRLMAKTMAMR